MLPNLLDDTIVYISSFLSFKEKINLIFTSKNLKNIFYNYGYLDTLHISHNYSMEKFTYLYYRHKRTLKSLRLVNLYDPHLWIPTFWCNKVYLQYCGISSPLNPRLSCNTDVIHITQTNSKIININWEKFPNLETLFLNGQDLNLQGINKCKKIKYIFLHLENKHKSSEYLSDLSKLENLECLISNIYINNEITLKSKVLKMKFRPGDLVIKNTGGNKMRIISYDKSGVQCGWITEVYHEDFFNEEELDPLLVVPSK